MNIPPTVQEYFRQILLHRSPNNGFDQLERWTFLDEQNFCHRLDTLCGYSISENLVQNDSFQCDSSDLTSTRKRKLFDFWSPFSLWTYSRAAIYQIMNSYALTYNLLLQISILNKLLILILSLQSIHQLFLILPVVNRIWFDMREWSVLDCYRFRANRELWNLLNSFESGRNR